MQLLKFEATWCGPCKILSAVLETIDHPMVKEMKVFDADANREELLKYNVRSVPTMIIVDDNGAVVRTKTGTIPKDVILQFLG